MPENRTEASGLKSCVERKKGRVKKTGGKRTVEVKERKKDN